MADGNTISSSHLYGSRLSLWGQDSTDEEHQGLELLATVDADIRHEVMQRIARARFAGIPVDFDDTATIQSIIAHAERDLALEAHRKAEQHRIAMNRRPLVTGSEVVYYIRFGDRVKIGTTTHLRNRLSAIPHDEVMAVEAGGRGVEQARHRQFAKLRITGEWFRYEGALKEFLDLV